MQTVKALLCANPVLAHFDARKQLVVQCDASKNGLGAVLLQDGHPLAYASRRLTPTEQGYAQIEKELLSVVFAMNKFHQYIYGPSVVVQNDHNHPPLVAIQKKPFARAPMRLQRMLMRLYRRTTLRSSTSLARTYTSRIPCPEPLLMDGPKRRSLTL